MKILKSGEFKVSGWFKTIALWTNVLKKTWSDQYCQKYNDFIVSKKNNLSRLFIWFHIVVHGKKHLLVRCNFLWKTTTIHIKVARSKVLPLKNHVIPNTYLRFFSKWIPTNRNCYPLEAFIFCWIIVHMLFQSSVN